MNICLVLVSDSWGGAEAVVWELARHLENRGHAVSVLVNHEILNFYRELGGVRLFNLGDVHPFRLLASRKLGTRTQYDLPRRTVALLCNYLDELYLHILKKKITWQIGDLIVKSGIQVVHSHLPDAIFLTADIPHARASRVATVHGEQALIGREPLNLLSGPLMKWREARFRKSLLKMDELTTVSTFMLNTLSAWEGRLKEKVVMIPNGISISEIQRDSGPTLTLRGDFNLLFPGGAKPRKGGPLVIQALSSLRKRIPRVHAYIAGQVPERHTLRKMITKIGLEPNTTVTGLLPTQEYRGLLKSVDVLVAPSYEEACPLVHLEAMAMGKPIVAGKTGGVREFVKNGRNGILVDLKSECIAKAILRLQRDTEFKNNIARNSLRDITEFDWDRIVERYVKVYQSLVPPRRIQLSFQDAHTAATPSLPRQTGDGPHQVPI